jgi:hypothetical protein
VRGVRLKHVEKLSLDAHKRRARRRLADALEQRVVRLDQLLVEVTVLYEVVELADGVRQLALALLRALGLLWSAPARTR